MGKKKDLEKATKQNQKLKEKIKRRQAKINVLDAPVVTPKELKTLGRKRVKDSQTSSTVAEMVVKVEEMDSDDNEPMAFTKSEIELLIKKGKKKARKAKEEKRKKKKKKKKEKKKKKKKKKK